VGGDPRDAARLRGHGSDRGRGKHHHEHVARSDRTAKPSTTIRHDCLPASLLQASPQCKAVRSELPHLRAPQHELSAKQQSWRPVDGGWTQAEEPARRSMSPDPTLRCWGADRGALAPMDKDRRSLPDDSFTPSP
jgi:hypothetical protein